MKTITVDQFLLFRPCYGEERIREIAGDKVEWSALDILHLTNVPANDRLWTVLRMRLIDQWILYKLVKDFSKEFAVIEDWRVKEPLVNCARSIGTDGFMRWVSLSLSNAASAVADLFFLESTIVKNVLDYNAEYDARWANAREKQCEMLIKLLEGEIEK